MSGQRGFVQDVDLTGMRKGGARFAVKVDSVILPGEPPLVWIVYRDLGGSPARRAG